MSYYDTPYSGAHIKSPGDPVWQPPPQTLFRPGTAPVVVPGAGASFPRFPGIPAPGTPTGGNAPGSLPGIGSGSPLDSMSNLLRPTATPVINLDYGSDPAYSEALRLLNPNDAQANYDVTLLGAQDSVAGGIPGSPLGGETTGRRRQLDIERRAALGNQLLTGASNRVLGAGQLSLDQARLALQDRIQSGQLSIENARMILDWLKASGYFGPQGGGGGGGGGRPTSGPLPGAGGGAPSQMPPWRNYSDPTMDLPTPSPGGWSQNFPSYDPSEDASNLFPDPITDYTNWGIPGWEGYDVNTPVFDTSDYEDFYA